MKDKVKLEKLINKARNGNQKAFEELYHAYVNDVYFTALQYFHNEATAKDIVQDVFLRVHRNLTKLDNPAAFYTWIKKITFNVCYDYDKKTEKTVDFGESVTIEDFEDINQQDAKEILENKDLQQMIYDEIQALKTPLRMVAMLRYYDDLSVREISDILEVPEGTVHSRLYHLKSKLKAKLEKQGISAHTLPSFVLSPALLKLAYSQGILQLEVPTSVVATSMMGVSTKVGMSTGLKVAIASSLTVVGVAAIIIINQSSTTKEIEKAEKPIITQPVVAVETAKIQEIVYPTAWTNQPFALQVRTTNTTYDEILVNQVPTLTVRQNGEYVVSLVYEGTVVDEQKIMITNFDFIEPKVVDYKIEGMQYTIYLRDDASQVNYQSIIYYENGMHVDKDMIIDEINQTLIVDCAFASTGTMFIYDYAGNRVELRLQDKSE